MTTAIQITKGAQPRSIKISGPAEAVSRLVAVAREARDRGQRLVSVDDHQANEAVLVARGTRAHKDAIRLLQAERANLEQPTNKATPAPAAPAASRPAPAARIPVANQADAPAAYGGHKLDGFGKAFVFDEAAHERNGAGFPELIGRTVQYAYYR
jgi:hypothetical protein